MSTSVYLSGPSITITDPTLPVSADWKTYAATTFLKSGIIVANPLDLDLTGFISTKDESTNAVKQSKLLIDKSDLLLANITQLTEATTMEMFYAHNQGKKVIVVGNEPFNPWVLFHSDARFGRLKEALDYLINQPLGFDVTSWVTEFEARLKKHSEEYPPNGELDFEYYGGELPVLVLAPHATSYFKNGTWNHSESYTGSLSVLLHKLTRCHSLISSYCSVIDPITYTNSPYANFVNQLIKKTNIKLILVLNGVEEWVLPYDLVINTWNKASLLNKPEFFHLLASMFGIKEIKNIGYDSKETLSENKTLWNTLFEDCSVPLIKIDIHKKYRQPKLHQSLFSNLHTALAQFVMLVGQK